MIVGSRPDAYLRYKVRNVTVFFIGAVVEVLRSEKTLNDTIKNCKKERVHDRYRVLLLLINSYQ